VSTRVTHEQKIGGSPIKGKKKTAQTERTRGGKRKVARSVSKIFKLTKETDGGL